MAVGERRNARHRRGGRHRRTLDDGLGFSERAGRVIARHRTGRAVDRDARKGAGHHQSMEQCRPRMKHVASDVIVDAAGPVASIVSSLYLSQARCPVRCLRSQVTSALHILAPRLADGMPISALLVFVPLASPLAVLGGRRGDGGAGQARYGHAGGQLQVRRGAGNDQQGGGEGVQRSNAVPRPIRSVVVHACGMQQIWSRAIVPSSVRRGGGGPNNTRCGAGRG